MAEDENQTNDLMFIAFERKFLPPFREMLIQQELYEPKVLDFIAQWKQLMPDKFLMKLVSVYLMPKLRREL